MLFELHIALVQLKKVWTIFLSGMGKYYGRLGSLTLVSRLNVQTKNLVFKTVKLLIDMAHGFGLVSSFNGISAFVGYLISSPFL